jgi:S-disulfanyl-L-cysteine oxidoreductase SoxD
MSRLTLSLLIGTVLCTSGCKVSPACRLETSLMTSAKRSIFVRNKIEKSPFPGTPENIAAGKEAFGHT